MANGGLLRGQTHVKELVTRVAVADPHDAVAPGGKVCDCPQHHAMTLWGGGEEEEEENEIKETKTYRKRRRRRR